MNKPRIVFAGTPDFALTCLTALLGAGHSVVAVYTQPDRPSGRGRQITASPVKRLAEERGIAVLQPPTFRDSAAAAQLTALQADLMIVVAYGLILPQNVLEIPVQGCLNVHASILPRWRGAAPVQASILANDETTGVSLMRMTAGLDCGPVFSMRSVVIGSKESAAELHDRLADIGGQLLVSDLPKIFSGEAVAVEQDESLATYAGKIRTRDAELDWNMSADELQRRIRAYNPAPGTFFFIDGKDSGEPLRVKVWQASIASDVAAQPGTFVQYDGAGIIVACGKDGLRLESLQLPGKRRAAADEFVAQIDLR